MAAALGAIRGDLNRAPRCCRLSILRGRKTVRADRRLRTDEEAVRAQSTIFYKSNPKLPLFLCITMFSVRMRFSSAQKTRLARASAQVRSWLAPAIETPFSP